MFVPYFLKEEQQLKDWEYAWLTSAFILRVEAEAVLMTPSPKFRPKGAKISKK